MSDYLKKILSFLFGAVLGYYILSFFLCLGLIACGGGMDVPYWMFLFIVFGIPIWYLLVLVYIGLGLDTVLDQIIDCN